MKKEIISETPIKEYDQSMFELTNGQDARIHDEALKTKPTTFEELIRISRIIAWYRCMA